MTASDSRRANPSLSPILGDADPSVRAPETPRSGAQGSGVPSSTLPPPEFSDASISTMPRTPRTGMSSSLPPGPRSRGVGDTFPPTSSQRAAHSQPAMRGPTRVLLVDDSPTLLSVIGSALKARDAEVTGVRDGHEALGLLMHDSFDVVVSDIHMPNMDGLKMLESVRSFDPDLPVVLMTSSPELSSAIRAIELGAFRYLQKPFKLDEIGDVVQQAAQLRRLARMRREATELAAESNGEAERGRLRSKLDDALACLEMAYQPIVDARANSIYGYEALMRTNLSPGEVLSIAERLDAVHELGRVVRAAVARDLETLPSGVLAFVNLHTLELEDDELFAPDAPLTRFASRVVLEVTERAQIADVDGLVERVAALRSLGFRVAIDDLGAGYSSLNSFAQLQPDFAKLDMALVKPAPTDAMRRRLIRSMTELCAEMNILVVAEGVETEAHRDTLLALGSTLMQGFYFARPARPYCDAKF